MRVGLSLAAQGHWSLYLMVGSWTLVEVPRYLYYAINLVTDKVRFLIRTLCLMYIG